MLLFARWSALLLLLGFTLPLLAQDVKKADDKKDAEKKADDKKGDEPKKEEKETLLPAGVLMGKITKLDEDKRTFKLEIAYQVPKLNEGEAQGYLNAQAAYQRAAMNPQLKPQQRAQDLGNALRDMQNHYAKLYTFEKKTKELELQLLEEAKVRTANPPIQFDDEGKLKQYTKKELEELKGDPKQPGFQAEYGDLATGQNVQVTLVRKKPAKPMKPTDKDGGDKPADKGAGGNGKPGLPMPKEGMNQDALADHLPLVSVIVILKQLEK